MSIVALKGYKVDKVDFVANLENGTQVKLGNKFQFHVQYAKNNMCKCEFDIEAYDANNPDKFSVHVVMSGIFAFKDGETKEAIHTATFKNFFPYVRAFVTTLTANCGIPPIILPDIDIDNQQIYRIDNNVQ